MPNNQGYKYMRVSNAVFKKSFIFLPILMIFIIVGCNKEPEYIPGAGIQGIRETISRILLSPIAYDGATVVIEGTVQNFSEQKEPDSTDPDDLESTFKLVDTRGNSINIVMPGQWEIAENDYLVVGGLYRKNPNEIEAKQFEKVDFEDKDEEEINKEIQKRDEW